MNNKPTVHMLIGLPCSGKTAYRNKFLKGFALSTDDYIVKCMKSSKMTYNEAFKQFFNQAERFMYQDLQFNINNGFSFAWDQTNLSQKSRKSKLAMIPNSWFKKAIVFPTPSLEEFNFRNLDRPNRISEEVFKDLHNKAEFPSFYEEGFDEIAFIGKSFFSKTS